MVLWSLYTKRTLPLHSMELIERFWMAVRSWWILCVLRLFQDGCLVDWEVVLVERSKVGKCDLVVGTVPSMLLMRVIGLSRNPILAMFLETSRAIEGEPSGNSARRQVAKSERIKTDITKTSEEKRGMKMTALTMFVLENTANQSIDITTITSIPVLAVYLVNAEGIKNTESAESIVSTEMKEGIEATKKVTVEKGNKIIVIVIKMLFELFVNKNAQTGDRTQDLRVISTTL